MKPIIATAIALFGLGTTASAQGQQVCMAAPDLKASLVDWYQERPAAGQASLKEQLWVSGRTGSWTIVKFLSDGNACVMSQGTNWEAGISADQLHASVSE